MRCPHIFKTFIDDDEIFEVFIGVLSIRGFLFGFKTARKFDNKIHHEFHITMKTKKKKIKGTVNNSCDKH